ncbi:MAG TPA: hypothetical protein VET48_04895 [Steroidobacteraceae bacterium]|nr:hypothetical protein [Steroidobacteraceae bacterium]
MNATELAQVRTAARKHALWLKKNLPNVYNGLVENLVVQQNRNVQQLGFILNDAMDPIALAVNAPSTGDVAVPAQDYSAAPTSDSTDSSGGLFSGLVDSFTNLLSSGGVKTLLNAAQPFLNNAVQQQALSTQVQQMRMGLPVTIAGTNVPMRTQPLPIVASGAISQLSSYLPWILLFGGGILLINSLKSSRAR